MEEKLTERLEVRVSGSMKKFIVEYSKALDISQALVVRDGLKLLMKKANKALKVKR